MRFLTTLLTFITTSALAGPVREGAVITELVPSKTSIAPGETIDIALRIAHDKGWHTYWKNPGLVGVPTELDWKLPKGFKAGKILWPQPERVKMGPYDAYGYHGEIFLIVPLTAPTNVRSGTTAKLKARASWMCCSTICQPAFVDLSLSVAVSDKPTKETRWAKPIKASRATFAKPNTMWKSTAIRSGEMVTLIISPTKGTNIAPPKDPYFFCEDGLIDSDEEQVIQKLENESISMRLKVSEFGPEHPTHLNGILYTKSGLPDQSKAIPIHFNVLLKSS